MTDLTTWFQDGLIKNIIKDFPYPERECAYCQGNLRLVSAIHLNEHKEHYKALFICYNPMCEAFDEPAGLAYARVYYSSPEAFSALETHRIWYDQPKKR